MCFQTFEYACVIRHSDSEKMHHVTVILQTLLGAGLNFVTHRSHKLKS